MECTLHPKTPLYGLPGCQFTSLNLHQLFWWHRSKEKKACRARKKGIGSWCALLWLRSIPFHPIPPPAQPAPHPKLLTNYPLYHLTWTSAASRSCWHILGASSQMYQRPTVHNSGILFTTQEDLGYRLGAPILSDFQVLEEPQCSPEEKEQIFPYLEEVSVTASLLGDAAHAPVHRSPGKHNLFWCLYWLSDFLSAEVTGELLVKPTKPSIEIHTSWNS